ALVDSSPLVVEARVRSVAAAPVALGTTDYGVEVTRVLKGRSPGGELVVRRLGGVNPEGEALEVWGLTHLGIGDRAVLFLIPNDDGIYGVNQLVMGAFREVEVGEERVAVRDLDGASELRQEAGAWKSVAGADRPRDVEGFVTWIAARAGGRTAVADYF